MAQCIDHAKLQLEGVKIERRKELGRGSYGFVIEVSVNGTTCAAKVIHEILVEQVANKDFEATEMMFLNECTNSSRMLHPNVVQFLGIYYPSPKDKLPWLIMEMMYTNLTSLIEKYETTDLPLHIKLSILVDTSQGLQYLHSKDVIHRDLSSNNILLTKHMVAKIADFGKAKVILKNTKQTEAPGTQAFMAPETLHDPAIYGKPLDVFSLSCVTAHVISMQWPLPSSPMQKDEQTGKSVMRSEVQRREKYLTKMTDGSPLKQLTVKCLQNDPDKRPTTEEVTKDLQNIKATICESMEHADCDILELLNRLHQQEQTVIDCQQRIIHQKAELQSNHKKEFSKIHAALNDKEKELSECKKENIRLKTQNKETEVQLLATINQLKEEKFLSEQQASKAMDNVTKLRQQLSSKHQKQKDDLERENATVYHIGRNNCQRDVQVEQLASRNEEKEGRRHAMSQQAGGKLKNSNIVVPTPNSMLPAINNSTAYTAQSVFSIPVFSGTVVKRINTTTTTRQLNTQTATDGSSSQYTSKLVNLVTSMCAQCYRFCCALGRIVLLLSALFLCFVGSRCAQCYRFCCALCYRFCCALGRIVLLLFALFLCFLGTARAYVAILNIFGLEIDDAPNISNWFVCISMVLHFLVFWNVVELLI